MTEFYFFLAFCVLFVAVAIRMLVRERRDDRYGDTWLGSINGIEVASVWDKKQDRYLVGLTIEQKDEGTTVARTAFLTHAQAHELAGWLRIASAPGKTILQAKRALRTTPNPAVPEAHA